MIKEMGKRVLVSACLLGWNCRYDGGNKLDPSIQAQAKKEGWSIVPVCPEVLAGLGIPRRPAVIEGGDGMDVIEGRARVINDKGKDVTKVFVLGAKKSLEIALRTGCNLVIFKEKSPSCGVKNLGVASAILKKNSIAVQSHP